MSEQSKIKITSKKHFFDFQIKEIFKFRDLVILLVKRDFKVFYKQTLLGPLWYIVQPLIYTMVFTIIFGRLASLSTDGIPDVLFYLSGTVIWTFFATSLTSTGNIFFKYHELFSKVYFPRLVIPISIIFTNSIQFFLQFIIFILFYFYYIFFQNFEPNFNLKFLFLPIIFLNILILSLGVGALISVLTSKYRDLGMVLNFLVQIWMFASPVVYPLSALPENYQLLASFNPMTLNVELFREIFFNSKNLSISFYLSSYFVTFSFLFFGVSLFNKRAKDFIDTV